ncbi:hypothetical protein SNE40_004575 [Patella caerulea]|uniref:Uncharacterized protein n=1 Tax=Patella caerulea TaxID=87958 RepID=A0AAN8PXC7_PATCE
MASIMKKVFGGLGIKHSLGKPSSPSTQAHGPPSPDLSGLSAGELQTLNEVFRRQTEFEQAEIQRIERIRKDLEKYEETIRAQAEAKKKLKHVDLRLCRLCYKTKFADGIGRLCYDCHKRVCTRCGSFTRPRWNVKKNKSVRGKWICNMCQLKRETLCKTGQWCGDDTYIPSGQVMLSKVNVYGTETESDLSGTMQNLIPSDSEKMPMGNLTDSELIRDMDTSRDFHDLSVRRARRCSLPVTPRSKSFDEDEDDVDDNQEELHRERLLFRQKRQQRKWRRRYLPSNHFSEESTYEMTSDTNDVPFSSGLSSEERKRPKLKSRYKSLPKLQLTGKFHSRSKLSLDSMTDDSSALSYLTKDSSISDCANSSLPLNKMQRQDAIYRSSSSSLVSDAKCVDGNGDGFSQLPNHKENRTAALRGFQSCCYQVASKEELLSRRVTLSQCENIEICQNSPFSGVVSSAAGNPHEVILHRDKSDPSQRTKGLGMRVVGGKEGDSGELGAFVSMVIKGGPADVQGGIKEGDQILEVDGQSLVGVTFEEARDITDKAGNVVQLVVLHQSQSNKLVSPGDRRVLKTGLSMANPLPPMNKPRRRMLPPTPIEIKKTTRKVSGRIQAQINYSPTDEILSVIVIKATDIGLSDEASRIPKPFAMVHILPQRSLFCFYETEPQKKTRNPEWNKTFEYPDIAEHELRRLSVEITIWSQKLTGDIFIGEVLLDLKDKVPVGPIWYDLEDHDENSSPLPDRKSSVGDISEADILIGSQDKGDDHPSVHRSLPSTPSYEHTSNRLLVKMQTVTGHGIDDHYTPSPTPSPTNFPDGIFNEGKRQSFSKKVKKRMSNAVCKVSLSLSISDKRENDSDGYIPRKLSRGLSLEQTENSDSPRMRKLSNVNLDMLAPPHPLSRRSSQSSYQTDGPSENDEDLLRDVPDTPDRPAPDGDDITSILGPGQLTPKPSAESEVCGDVKLGFMITKGQLEVDIYCARNLYLGGTNTSPDTYIKTYLVEGRKIIQKKKTRLIKASSVPQYRSKIKYSASNVHGRCMRITIWEKSKGFDKKIFVGEAVVKLDSLDLSLHTMAWYKLFKQNATDLGSNDSLNW